jgi:cyclophilin family peptidyl-prolyl cis-trans isomerase
VVVNSDARFYIQEILMHRLSKQFLACLAMIPLFVSPAAADDSAKSAADQFAEANKEFKQIDTDIRAIIKEFPDASEDRRVELRKDYEKLAERGRALLPKLRKVGLAAFKDAPNKDKDVTEVLLQVAAADIQNDRNTAAKEITDLLISHKSEFPGLQDLAGLVAYSTDDFEAAEKLLQQAKDEGTLSPQGQNYLSQMETTKKNWEAEKDLRAKEADANDLPRVKLATSKGDIVVELYENEAPQAVGNFISLVEKKFYDGLSFHRVIPNFMAQGGCPKGTGTGGPGYKIYCECTSENHRNHFTGSLSMAHSGPNTGGSQFYVTFRPTPHLDGKHTVFGRVIEGMDVLAELQRGGEKPDKIAKATVVRKRDHEYKPTKVK